MIQRREARLELSANLRHPLAVEDAEALVALLAGRKPRHGSGHPLFRHPDADMLLTGESLDHATTGSRVAQEENGQLRLHISASLPSCPALLAAGLDWLGGILALQPGDVSGFIVPAGAPRHDMRLLAWDGGHLRALPGLAAETPATWRCSLESFLKASGLPGTEEDERQLRAALRRVALAQLEGRCLPVAQAQLDGPFRDGQGLFRLWMAQVLSRLEGLTTASPQPMTLCLA